jgi:hypothetical protein
MYTLRAGAQCHATTPPALLLSLIISLIRCHERQQVGVSQVRWCKPQPARTRNELADKCKGLKATTLSLVAQFASLTQKNEMRRRAQSAVAEGKQDLLADGVLE